MEISIHYKKLISFIALLLLASACSLNQNNESSAVVDDEDKKKNTEVDTNIPPPKNKETIPPIDSEQKVSLPKITLTDMTPKDNETVDRTVIIKMSFDTPLAATTSVVITATSLIGDIQNCTSKISANELECEFERRLLPNSKYNISINGEVVGLNGATATIAKSFNIDSKSIQLSMKTPQKVFEKNITDYKTFFIEETLNVIVAEEKNQEDEVNVFLLRNNGQIWTSTLISTFSNQNSHVSIRTKATPDRSKVGLLMEAKDSFRFVEISKDAISTPIEIAVTRGVSTSPFWYDGESLRVSSSKKYSCILSPTSCNEIVAVSGYRSEVIMSLPGVTHPVLVTTSGTHLSGMHLHELPFIGAGIVTPFGFNLPGDGKRLFSYTSHDDFTWMISSSSNNNSTGGLYVSTFKKEQGWLYYTTLANIPNKSIQEALIYKNESNLPCIIWTERENQDPIVSIYTSCLNASLTWSEKALLSDLNDNYKQAINVPTDLIGNKYLIWNSEDDWSTANTTRIKSRTYNPATNWSDSLIELAPQGYSIFENGSDISAAGDLGVCMEKNLQLFCNVYK